MKGLVVGVSGGIAVGKSAFIASLAAALGAGTTAFGDVVREEAARRKLDASSRQVLQDLGEQLKRDLGDEAFVGRVLARASAEEIVVVDGVRHVEIADAIERVVAPRRFVLILLEADQETRRARAVERSPDDAARLGQLATHATERQVHDGSMQARADLVLDARKAVETLVAETLTFLRGLLEEPGMPQPREQLPEPPRLDAPVRSGRGEPPQKES